jgi:hypothetical protein
MNQLNSNQLAEMLFNKRPKLMKRRILYILACLSLLSLNALIMNLAHADEETEIVEADSSYFSDDSTSPAPVMYDEEGNMISENVNSQLNQAGPIGNNALSEIDEEDTTTLETPTAQVNSDSEVISGSAPLYNQN